MKQRILLALALVLGIGLVSKSASAQDSGPQGFRVGALIGGGVVMNNETNNNWNPMGFGIGVQAGYTFDFGLYAGADLRWFIGEKLTTAFTDSRFNALQFTADIGWDFQPVDRLVLRPMVGLGVSRYKVHTDINGGTSTTDTDAGFLLALGFEALYDVTDMLYVGGQIRLPVVAFMGDGSNDIATNSSGNDIAFQGMGTVGLRF